MLRLVGERKEEGLIENFLFMQLAVVKDLCPLVGALELRS